jgi:Protein of unknown function (DUF1579)
MKLLLNITTFVMLVTLMACNNSANTTATDSKAKSADSTTTPPPPPSLDSATIAKNWQAYMTPGDVHKMMAKMSGTWNGDISMWMKPGDEPMKNTGTAVYKMILNGLYQQGTHTGNMMGMPFAGESTMGYDNAKKIFVSTWVDNMGTGIMYLSGPWDEATKTITLTGKMVDPGTYAEVDVKETLQVVDDNTQIMTMYAPGPDGKEFKTMEIKSTRKK